MAGPPSGFARLFAAPGVPRYRAVKVFPVASSQLPFKRSRISGSPASQRTLARIVAVWPEFNVDFNVVRTRLAPVSPRSVARTWRQRVLLL